MDSKLYFIFNDSNPMTHSNIVGVIKRGYYVIMLPPKSNINIFPLSENDIKNTNFINENIIMVKQTVFMCYNLLLVKKIKEILSEI